MSRKPIVAVARCDNNDPGSVADACDQAVRACGGFPPRPSVNGLSVLKPNLMGPFAPEDCVTTHPSVMRSVAQMLQRTGRDVLISDSPAGALPTWNPQNVLKQTGAYEAASQIGCDCRPIESYGVRDFALEDNFSVPISDLVGESEVVNVPKLKTHVLTGLSCAIKNLFGLVVGASKVKVHYKYKDLDRFCGALCRICDHCQPIMTIVDAVEGIEGDGPGVRGERKRFGCIIAGTDARAVDMAVALLAGIDPEGVPLLRSALQIDHEMGYPEIVICDGGQFALSLKLPQMHLARCRMACSSLEAGQTEWRIAIDQNICDRCDHCVRLCPTGSLQVEDSKIAYDWETCISCMCCLECCGSGAISVERSSTARS